MVTCVSLQLFIDMIQGWALQGLGSRVQGYTKVGHCNERLGTGNTHSGWALQGYSVVGHYRHGNFGVETLGHYGGKKESLPFIYPSKPVQLHISTLCLIYGMPARIPPYAVILTIGTPNVRVPKPFMSLPSAT